jgi:hypothetical protein
MTLKTLILAIGIAILGFATPASAFSGGNFPACDAPQVLNYIQKRFHWTDRVLLKRGLAIESIERAHRQPQPPWRPILVDPAALLPWHRLHE